MSNGRLPRRQGSVLHDVAPLTVDHEGLLGFLMRQPHGFDYFNPWYGDDEAANQRRRNLLEFLQERRAAPILLVAEAPGYRGCRQTGVPLTDPSELSGTGTEERTATYVYEALRDFGIVDDVVMWNVFPFHPHPPGVHDRNRRLLDSEAKPFAPLVRFFAPASRSLVVAVGGKAKLGMTSAGIRFSHIPHPIRRKTQFRQGLATLVDQLRTGTTP